MVPCGSTRPISPDSIMITALHLNKTYNNLEVNPKVAVVFDTEMGKGERKDIKEVKGTASLVKFLA